MKIEELFTAVHEGNKKKIASWLKSDDLEHGEAVLMHASAYGNKKILRMLSRKKIDINYRDQYGVTALMCAIGVGNAENVRILIKRGADIHKINLYRIACFSVTNKDGHPYVEEVLFNDEYNALMYASQNGHADIVEILIKNGVDVNAKINTTTKYVREAHKDIAELIARVTVNSASQKFSIFQSRKPFQHIAHGTAVNAGPMLENRDLRKMLLKRGILFDIDDPNEYTALMLASREGHKDVAKMLIAHGAAVNAVAQDGHTALMLAAENGRTETAKMLIEHGANIHDCDRNGKTSLVNASENGRTKTVNMLIECGAFDVLNQNVINSLIAASVAGHAETVALLIEKGARINVSDLNGNTPLMASAKNGHVETIKILLKNGAYINARNGDGQNALMLASENGHAEVVKILFEKKILLNQETFPNKAIYVDVRKHDRQTALMLASKKGHVAVVEILLENGADVHAKDRNGRTALDLATDENVKKILCRAKISAGLWSKKELTKEDLAKVKEEEVYVRQEIERLISLKYWLLLHVIGRAENELREWLRLDDRNDDDKDESHDLLKNTYRKISEKFGCAAWGTEGYFCAREIKKFENRIAYQAMGEEYFKHINKTDEFKKPEDEAAIKSETEEIFKKILEILESNGEMSMDDVQRALDFVHYDHLGNIKDMGFDQNDLIPSYAALVALEENERQRIFAKAGLPAEVEKEDPDLCSEKKLITEAGFREREEEKQKAAFSQGGRRV